MNEIGERGTDEAFHQLMTTVCGAALLKLLGMDAETTKHYLFRSTVLKAKELRPDLEAISTQPDGQRIFIEFQGYSEPWIRQRLNGSIILSCRTDDYRGPVLGAIIFTSKSYQKAALPLAWGDPYGDFCLSGRFREIVLTDYAEAELLAIDQRLVVLAPWTMAHNESLQQLEGACRRWCETITSVYEPQQQGTALDVLALFLLNRFHDLSYEEIIIMLHFDLSNTRAGQQLLEMGKNEGIKEGKKEGKKVGKKEGMLKATRQMFLIALATRFNNVPDDILAAVHSINSPAIFHKILPDILRCDAIETVGTLLRSSNGK